MDKLNINVFCNLAGTGIEDVLKSVTLGSDVNIRFCGMFDDAVGYCILLSESVDEALAFKGASSKGARLYSVFVGNSRQAENRCDYLDDIWPAGENAIIIKSRFRKLIYSIRDAHIAWFYKNLYGTMIDSIPELSWCKDVHGRYFNVNRSFSDLVRKSKDECEGKDYFDIWNVDREEHVNDSLLNKETEELVRKEQRTLKFDETICAPDGMMKLATYKSPVTNEFGDVVGTVGFAHDITSLANAQHENDLLVESVPFPVIVVDSNWRTKMINGTMRRLLQLKGPIDNFDYLTWKKYFLTPVSEPVVNAEHHYVNQIFASNDNTVNFSFQINEQDIIDVFGEVTGHIIIPRKLGPRGEMQGVPVDVPDN